MATGLHHSPCLCHSDQQSAVFFKAHPFKLKKKKVNLKREASRRESNEDECRIPLFLRTFSTLLNALRYPTGPHVFAPGPLASAQERDEGRRESRWENLCLLPRLSSFDSSNWGSSNSHSVGP